MKITFQIDATVNELADLASRFQAAIGRRVEILGTDVSTSTMTLHHPERYQYSGRVDDYGQRDAFDRRTGRRGAFMDGLGFVPGAIVQDDGRIEFEHPWDNPYH